jgi:hypothetical protein
MATAIPANYGGFAAPPTAVAIGSRPSPITDPNWGVTHAGDLGNLATRPEFAMAVREEVFHSYAWVQSGIIARDPRLDASARGPRIEIPLIKPFIPHEETVKSNSTWGINGKGFLTPQKINAGQMFVPISHRAFAAGADELSEIITGLDPMAEIQGYLASGMQRLETQKALSLYEGAFGTALSSHVLDVTRKATGTSSEANFLSASVLMRAKNLLGERGNAMTIAAMHSSVANYLSIIGMLTFSTDSLSQGGNIAWGGGGVGVTSTQIADMAGYRVVVDDSLAPITDATNGDKFPVYLQAPGILRQGIQRALRIRYGENILSFESVMAVDYHGAMAINGVSWKSPSDNPENTDLRNKDNWELAYDDSRLVPLVKILVNSPLAANP